MDCSEVKILHCSGGYGQKMERAECNFECNNELDPHLPSSVEDWQSLIDVMGKTPNLFRVSNEIAYSGKHGNPITLREYCQEAILTKIAVCSRHMHTVQEAIAITTHLKENCSNLTQIINQCLNLL